MIAIITFFFVMLAAAVVIPTLHSSRRVRLIAAAVALPAVIAAYMMIENRASYIGAGQMDMFIAHSEELLKKGDTQLLIAAYQEYREQHGGHIPKGSSAAYRAYLLENLLRMGEIAQRQDKK